MLNRFRIGVRLAAAFGVLCALLAALGVASLVSVDRLNRVNHWNVHTYRVIGTAERMARGMLDIETGTRGFVAAGAETFLEPVADGRRLFAEAHAEAKRLTEDNPAQQQRLDRILGHHDDFMKVAGELTELRRSVAAGRASAEQMLAAFGAGRDKAAMDAFRTAVGEFKATEESLLATRAAEAASAVSFAYAFLSLAGAAAIAIAALLAWRITASVTRPLGRAVELADGVADGDLTVRAVPEGRDEVAALTRRLDEMRESLARTVGTIVAGSREIGTATSELARGNIDLSSRTEQQSSSLQETASAMEELTGTVRQTAENARDANQLAQVTSETATRGGEAVQRVVRTMASISESANKVREIISVIDGIAFQTNILALNAAVEAARAGEQGRGFAVVASEVRSLAQRSADAAREIKRLIEDSVSKVGDGAELVEQAGATMQEVVRSVRRVTDLIGEISSATEQQSSGIEQVNQAVAQLDSVTQQNAALVEEAAAATQSMERQSSRLAEAVSVFRIAAADAAGTPAESRPAAAGRPAARAVPAGAEPGTPRAAAPDRANGASPGSDADWDAF
ncbi:MAG TPA: methyl-accepting chemotaxis protein [Burkholderiaceae bacterium]|nr:methyl-accepting chemotaxis protein [Burkholderiaceae bacterium]